MVNYGGLPQEYSTLSNSKVVVLPIPYDGTSTWVKGSDKGPEALLEASANMELYDIETNSEPYRIGIHTAAPVTSNSSPEAMVEESKKRAIEILNNDKFLVTIGGEHSVSIGIIQAFAEKFEKLSVIQIDAHADLREEYEGSPNNHACVMARAKELCPIVQIGIRSMDIEENKNLNHSRVFWGHQITHNDSWMEEAIDMLTENVYLTIDLDGLDPSILPSTGTPEPGGLLWYQTLKFLKKLTDRKKLVGFDVVELCPSPSEKSSDFVAAKLVYKILAYRFNSELRRKKV
jgi:agmatinase